MSKQAALRRSRSRCTSGTLRTLPTLVLYAESPFAEIRCRRREQDGTRWNGKVDPGLIYVDLAIYLLCAENIPTQNEAYILPSRPPIPVAVSENYQAQTGTTVPSHENFHAHPPSPLLPDPSANSWNRSINESNHNIADPRPKRNSEINATFIDLQRQQHSKNKKFPKPRCALMPAR